MEWKYFATLQFRDFVKNTVKIPKLKAREIWPLQICAIKMSRKLYVMRYFTGLVKSCKFILISSRRAVNSNKSYSGKWKATTAGPLHEPWFSYESERDGADTAAAVDSESNFKYLFEVTHEAMLVGIA